MSSVKQREAVECTGTPYAKLCQLYRKTQQRYRQYYQAEQEFVERPRACVRIFTVPQRSW